MYRHYMRGYTDQTYMDIRGYMGEGVTYEDIRDIRDIRGYTGKTYVIYGDIWVYGEDIWAGPSQPP